MKEALTRRMKRGQASDAALLNPLSSRPSGVRSLLRPLDGRAAANAAGDVVTTVEDANAPRGVGMLRPLLLDREHADLGHIFGFAYGEPEGFVAQGAVREAQDAYFALDVARAS